MVKKTKNKVIKDISIGVIPFLWKMEKGYIYRRDAN